MNSLTQTSLTRPRRLATVPVAVSVEPEFVVGAGLLLAAPPAVRQQHVVVESLGSEHAVQAGAVDAVLHHHLPQPHAAALQSDMFYMRCIAQSDMVSHLTNFGHFMVAQ